MTAKILEAEIGNFKFLLRGAAFINSDNGEIKFATREEAKDFLCKFLLVESVAGTNFSSKELTTTFRKIKKMVRKNHVDSEKLPVLPPKQQTDKELSNVIYSLEGNVCKYKKKTS